MYKIKCTINFLTWKQVFFLTRPFALGPQLKKMEALRSKFDKMNPHFDDFDSGSQSKLQKRKKISSMVPWEDYSLIMRLLHLCCSTGIAGKQVCIGTALPRTKKSERRNGLPKSREINDLAAERMQRTERT